MKRPAVNQSNNVCDEAQDYLLQHCFNVQRYLFKPPPLKY